MKLDSKVSFMARRKFEVAIKCSGLPQQVESFSHKAAIALNLTDQLNDFLITKLRIFS